MDAHAQALLQWAGPALLSGFGIIICCGLRAVYCSFMEILRRNEDEHAAMKEIMLAQNARLIEVEARQAENIKRQREAAERGERFDSIAHEHGERITRVETRVERAERDISGLRGK